MCRTVFSLLLTFCALTARAETVQIAFYADWAPITYAKNRDPKHADFHILMGFYADLYKAWESIPEADVHFTYTGLKRWDKIWMQVRNPNIDLVCGISILDERTRDDVGKIVIQFTDPHLHFRQSLLVRKEDSKRLKAHKNFGPNDTIGAVPGTTGETALLEKLGIIDHMRTGILGPGMLIKTKSGPVLTDGTQSIFDPIFDERQELWAQNKTSPKIIYRSGEDLLLPDLTTKRIDAIARGEIGNRVAADASSGEYQVVGLFPETITDKNIEKASCVVEIGEEKLAAKVNHFLGYLTNRGEISYDHWQQDPLVFQKRAMVYKSRNITSKNAH